MSLISWHSYIDIPINFHIESGIVTFWSIDLSAPRNLKWIWDPLSRSGWELWLCLGSPQGIQTSLHLVRWKMSLHLSHCRESRPCFESGYLGVHYTWGRKHRVALTYLFLREGSSWVACGSWLTFSVEDTVSFSSPDDMWCTEISSNCSSEINDPLYLRPFSHGISRIS